MNAHILRQWYLKNFTDTGTKSGKIFCYSLEKQRYVHSNGVSTKGLWWRKNTYSKRNSNKNQRSHEIEKEFSEYESKITSWIDGIIKLLDWMTIEVKGMAPRAKKKRDKGRQEKSQLDRMLEEKKKRSLLFPQKEFPTL